jgi:hypothetical protein
MVMVMTEAEKCSIASRDLAWFRNQQQPHIERLLLVCSPGELGWTLAITAGVGTGEER